jgi:tight adherence protein B
MQVAVTVFVVVLGIFLGTYWLLVLRPEEQAGRALRRRLRPTPVVRTAEAVPLLRRIVPVSTVPLLAAYLKRSGALVRRVEKRIQQAGLSVPVGRVLLSMGFVGIVAFGALLLLTQQPLVALAAGLLAGAVPYVIVGRLAERRVARFEEQFPEAIELIARALRAGHALTTGIGMVAEESPEPVRGEFRLLHDRQNYGMPLPDALRSFGERVPLLDARFFVTAVLTQREAGGNLSEVLDSLAMLIRERFKLRRQVRVMSAHGRITGAVLGGLPFVIGGLLFLIAPEHITRLFTDPLGIRMLALVGALQLIGFYAMRRIVDIEI